MFTYPQLWQQFSLYNVLQLIILAWSLIFWPQIAIIVIIIFWKSQTNETELPMSGKEERKSINVFVNKSHVNFRHNLVIFKSKFYFSATENAKNLFLCIFIFFLFIFSAVAATKFSFFALIGLVFRFFLFSFYLCVNDLNTRWVDFFHYKNDNWKKVGIIFLGTFQKITGKKFYVMHVFI